MNLQQGTKKKKGKGVKGKMIKTKWCGLKETLTNYGTQQNKTIQEEIMKLQRTKQRYEKE